MRLFKIKDTDMFTWHREGKKDMAFLNQTVPFIAGDKIGLSEGKSVVSKLWFLVSLLTKVSINMIWLAVFLS